MITGILTATGFNGPLTGVVNGVALATAGPPTDFLNAAGGYSVPQGQVPAARDLAAGAGLTGGGTLAADRAFNVGANADASIVVNPDDIQVGVLATDAQHGERGGGAQHADVVSGGAAGFMTGADKATLEGLASGAVPDSRTLTAGNGLTGGGTLAADRTFNVAANADASIVVNPDDIQVGVLATDAQHGERGGGAQHSDVVAAGASGFMTGADKTLLDGLVSTGPFLPLGGGTMLGDIKMQGVRLRFPGGGGDFRNFLQGNVANSGRLSLFTLDTERLSIQLNGFVTMLAGFGATALKSGTFAVPPAGLITGEFWKDTTDSATQPILRLNV